MHIPDGYLSPQTYAPAYGVMLPLWWRASAVLRKTLRNRQVPILALGAAFSFVIMMFNVPIPGGSTGHAVGGVLVAILLGPWAAVVAVTLALVVQALMFGDGGVTAIGANCLNMAVLMPFAGWGVYRLIARGAPADSRRQWIGAAVGGYVGLNVAALAAGLMFGIQPLIAHDAAGHALYCPFGLKVAIPAMCGTHLLLFGFVEAVVTGLVIAYLQRVEPSLLPASDPPRSPLCKGGRAGSHPYEGGAGGGFRRIGVIVGVLILLSPLGLYLPARFGAGSAWGEWSADEIAKLAGYVPAGLRHEAWKAPIPDYSLPGRESAPLATQAVFYVLAGLAGVAIIVLIAYAMKRLVWRKTVETDTGLDASADNV
jgi:cobalt/nickel transport system permease protein